MRLQHGNRHTVLEVYLGRLRRNLSAKTEASVVGQSFKVDRIGQAKQDAGFASAGASAENPVITVGNQLVQAVDQETPKRLVATLHQGVVNACVFDPLLGQPRA